MHQGLEKLQSILINSFIQGKLIESHNNWPTGHWIPPWKLLRWPFSLSLQEVVLGLWRCKFSFHCAQRKVTDHDRYWPLWVKRKENLSWHDKSVNVLIYTLLQIPCKILYRDRTSWDGFYWEWTFPLWRCRLHNHLRFGQLSRCQA